MRMILLILTLCCQWLAGCDADPAGGVVPGPYTVADATPCATSPDAGPSVDAAPMADAGPIVPDESLWTVHLIGAVTGAPACSFGSNPRTPLPTRMQFSVAAEGKLIATFLFDSGYSDSTEWGQVDATTLWTGERPIGPTCDGNNTGVCSGTSVAMDAAIWTLDGGTLHATVFYQGYGPFTTDGATRRLLCGAELLAVKE